MHKVNPWCVFGMCGLLLGSLQGGCSGDGSGDVEEASASEKDTVRGGSAAQGGATDVVDYGTQPEDSISQGDTAEVSSGGVDTGDTGPAGDTGDVHDSGDGGDSGDIGDSGDTGDTEPSSGTEAPWDSDIYVISTPTVDENGRFVHPGLSHKLSDLDRIKLMVRAKVDPWYSSYQDMCSLATAQYDYQVKGSVDITDYGVDRGWKDPWFNDDARAAYYGALRWYIEEDERYAQKAVEAIMAWTGLTNTPAMSLKTCPIWLMIEAAEILRHTYDGWSEEDIKKFEDMLVYPGYSNTTAPTGNKTWYWNAYMFDEARAGNQELCGVRTVAAIGVFLDNEIIYDRAMRYVSGLPHRPDDLPYAPGPRVPGEVDESLTTEYSIAYTIPNPANLGLYPDWGYCGVLQYNIYPNGQNVESSRDQGHTMFSLGMLSTLGEIAWNQGYDLWGLLDSRILKGLEYTLRYCVSSVQSFPDQPEPWEPVTFIDVDELPEPGTPEADVDFIRILNRTARNKSWNISPISRDGFVNINSWELPIAHYVGRGLKSEDEVKWTIRARDYARQVRGTYERASTGQDYTGYGALLYTRIPGLHGDPIRGFSDSGAPIYQMNMLPMTIEAENFDHFTANGQGHTYADNTAGNAGGAYRTDEDVDIAAVGDGFAVVKTEPGEYLLYTVYVPADGAYRIAVRYAAQADGGAVRVSFGDEDKTGAVALPATGGAWKTLVLADRASLSQGIVGMKVAVEGTGGFQLDRISVVLPEKLQQEITFEPLLIRELGDDDVPLRATANSGLPVVFTSADDSVVRVEDGVLRINGVGTTTVTASQAGNELFAPAAVSQTMRVNPPGSALVVQAEDYSAARGLATETTEDVGGGADIGHTSVGDWAEYTVDIPAAGPYMLELRVASDSLGGTVAVLDDGAVIDTVQFAATGGWQVWDSVGSGNLVSLSAGTHTLRIEVVADGWNLNWFKLHPAF